MAISYSKLKLYNQCPRRHSYKYIHKLPEPETTNRTAADRGTLLHEAAEAYIKGETNDLPFELMKWEQVLLKLREDKVLTEVTLLLDADWQPTKDPDKAYIKAIIDTLQLGAFEAEVSDWKTGSPRDYSGQLEFYSAVVLATYQNIPQVRTRIRYIDKRKSEPGATHYRKDLPTLRKKIESSISRMEDDKIRAPNPSHLCAFCPYSKRVGGPCKW